MQIKIFEYTKTFLANTSIRGFSRIIRTESIFIRWLWTVYIFTNTLLLSISIHRVLLDYWQYSVNIQTYTRFDNGTAFPAVTFCNHQPFSLTAYNLWNSGQVMSPTEFNKKLRLLSRKYLDELEKTPTVENMMKPLLWTTVMDRLSIYYQSLEPEVSAQLGHNQSMFHHCMWWYGKHMAFGESCKDDMLVVKRFSHPSYFNCYTVEPIKRVAMDISRIGAIIWLGPNEDIDIRHKQGFLVDIFEQAYGLRVSVHEAGSYPNIDQMGRQIEPGRLNELNFQPVLNLRVNSPTKKCNDNPTVTYQDLGVEFNYDKELCLNYEIQKVVVEKCGCLYGYYPRYFFPNKTHNYCGHLNFTNDKKITDNLNCLGKYMDSSSGLKTSLEKSCLLRCRNIDYDLAVSVTKWRPTEWQLYWLKQVNQHFQRYEDVLKNYTANSTTEKEKLNLESQMKIHLNYFKTFLTRANLSRHSDSANSQSIFGDRYSFVVVKRRDNNTFVKEERFVLTFSALISRIGGLSSLYIGLTFAFFAEVIEYFYVCLFTRPDNDKQKASSTTVVIVSENSPKKNDTQGILLKEHHLDTPTNNVQRSSIQTRLLIGSSDSLEQ